MPEREQRDWERAFVERHRPALDRELLGTILYSASDEADAERQAQEWLAPGPPRANDWGLRADDRRR